MASPPPDRVVGRAASLRRLRESDAGLALLRADLFPVIAAVLAEHLGGTTRVRPAVEFLELLADDLDVLRDAGFDLPRSAVEYLGEWVRQGLVVRRPGEGREETVELSAQAQAAVRFASGLETHRSAVTSSRLANVSDMLTRLAQETDTDQSARLAALRRQRDALDAELAAVEAGHFTPLADEVALERLAEVLRLAAEVPGDFARVSDDLEQLNRGLRERIINHPGTRGDVLDEVFAGVDLIEDSDAGRTFRAFHDLVLDADRAATFDDAVAGVLDRPFTQALTPDEGRFLRGLLSTLQNESTQVRAVMTGFSRSLRRFVESHAYREHRRLADAIAVAASVALDAARVLRPFDASGYELDASSIPLGSIGSWTLHNPADVRTAEPVEARPSAPLDLEALRRQVRESEIDFEELRAAVVETVERLGPVTAGQVLADHPPTQGLASVVGLLLLGHASGQRLDGSEALSWTTTAGSAKTVSAGRYLFDHVPEHWRQR